jgi:hypothetical protein
MASFLRLLDRARRLFWLLDLLVDPQAAADALLDHPKVKRWLEKQTVEDQQKVRDAAPLVMGAVLASLG